MSQYGTYDVSMVLSSGNTDTSAEASSAVSASGAIALNAAASGTVAAYTWTLNSVCRVKRIGFRVTTAFVYTTAQVTEGVVAIDKRVLPASDTGRVEVARIDLQTGLTLGQVRVLDVPSANQDCAPGDQLVFQIVTAGSASGGATGNYRPFIELVPRAETAANITDLSLSTHTQVV